jgi:hypothetical protein
MMIKATLSWSASEKMRWLLAVLLPLTHANTEYFEKFELKFGVAVV